MQTQELVKKGHAGFSGSCQNPPAKSPDREENNLFYLLKRKKKFFWPRCMWDLNFLTRN